ncbi:MAG TPA: hypothetical protein V6D26_13745 [Stenomitos sp.]
MGLGSGRNYSKAAKVVEAIDRETHIGNLETARTLRQVLNSKSVDAAVKLLKHSTKEAKATSNSNNKEQNQSSTFQSESRVIQEGERIIGLSPESREGTVVKCNYTEDSYQVLFDGDKAPKHCQRVQLQPLTSSKTGLTLSFSPHLQSLFEDAARAAEMSVVEWAHHQLKIAALSARRANQLSERGQN